MGTMIQTLDYKMILDHLFSAKRFWYVALPGIYDELAEGIIEARKRRPNLEIEMVIDPTETAFRSHHGSIDAIQLLKNCEINVKQIPNHRLGFIMSEESGWLLFIQSRAVEKDTTGPNAIQMNELLMQQVLSTFFDKGYDADFIFISPDLPVDYSTGKEVKPEPLDDYAFDEVSEKLASNPPPSPDFKRVYDVYSTKIKFIEFEVKGVKLHQRTISIPNDILALVDENLRDQIRTRLNIFDEDYRKSIEAKLSEIDKRSEAIRNKYLKRSISRKKSVLHAKNLKSFNDEIDSLKEHYEHVQKEVEVDVRSALISLKNRLTKELLTIYEKATPEELLRFKNDDQFPLFLKNYAEEKAGRIRLPSPQSLMNGFEINKRVFDPTYEDFSDQDFISELEEIGFIDKAEKNEIVDQFEAIGTQKDERG